MFIIDDSLSSQPYERVLSDATFFPPSMGGGEKIAEHLNSYHDEKADCYAPFMFWDGWWKSEANTLKKQVIRELWESHLPIEKEQILGFEYWTRTYHPGQYLDIHVDEDTFLYRDEKIFRGPFFGGIWYGIDNPCGGFLELFNSLLIDGTELALERENIDRATQDEKSIERIAYRGNRFIGFDAGHVLHRTTPATSGIRQVMVMNIWTVDNPPTALRLGEFIYE
jgi:hypothetical protein